MENLPTIFISSIGDLLKTAEMVYLTIGITDWGEHESLNYPPNNHYTRGYAKNVVVKICDSDDDDLSRFPFMVLYEDVTYKAGDMVVSIDPSAIALSLTAEGINTLVPKGEWWLDSWKGEGIEYNA